MKAADFRSTPDDLLASAIRYGEFFAAGGWRVAIEPFDLAFPRSPVFVAKRDHTKCVVEVQSSLELAVAEEWARFCSSCDRDTRIVVALVGPDPPSGEVLERLRGLGIGLMLVGDDGPYELVPAIDLALGITLPELPETLRPSLGAAYDLFQKGEWRDGFEHACTRLEQEARKYLRARVRRGGAQFVSASGQPKSYTDQQIGKMTQGQLSVAFQELRSPNVADSRIGQSLKVLNPDRITAVHFKGTVAAREVKLRRAVAKNMFIVVNGLACAKGLKR